MGHNYLLSAVIPATCMYGRMQTFKNWLADCVSLNIEIIVVHDKRDELTGVELKAIMDENPDLNFQYFESFLGSPGMARNLGKFNAQGKWVVFWDIDDLPVPRKLFEILESIDTNEEIDILITGSEIHDKTRQSIKYIGDFELETAGYNLGLWRMIFRRGLISTIEFLPIKWGEDLLFFSQVMSKNPQIKIVNEITYKYFRGIPNQLSSKREYFKDLEVALMELDNIDISHSKMSDTLLSIKSRLYLSLIKNSFPENMVYAMGQIIENFRHSSNKSRLVQSIFRLLVKSFNGG